MLLAGSFVESAFLIFRESGGFSCGEDEGSPREGFILNSKQTGGDADGYI